MKLRQVHPAIMAADRFMAIGGRLMINPRGKFVAAIDGARILLNREGVDERRQVARVFDSIARVRGSTLRLKNLVSKRGLPIHGWLVLAGEGMRPDAEEA